MRGPGRGMGVGVCQNIGFRAGELVPALFIIQIASCNLFGIFIFAKRGVRDQQIALAVYSSVCKVHGMKTSASFKELLAEQVAQAANRPVHFLSSRPPHANYTWYLADWLFDQCIRMPGTDLCVELVRQAALKWNPCSS